MGCPRIERTNIPAFRLPAKVLDEEIGYIVDMGADLRLNSPIKSMKQLLDAEEYDACSSAPARPRARSSSCPAATIPTAFISGSPGSNPSAFGHIDKVGEKVLIIGVGNTAMDCCRSSLRLGAKNVKVMARKPRQFFKASEWELEDAEAEKVESSSTTRPSPSSSRAAADRHEVREIGIRHRERRHQSDPFVGRCVLPLR